MSWTCRLTGKEDASIICENPHDIKGSIYATTGSKILCMSVTYNYSKIYRNICNMNDALWDLDGMKLNDSKEFLQKAIDSLWDEEPNDDYWVPTIGNAKDALKNLLKLADMVPEEYVDIALWRVN